MWARLLNKLRFLFRPGRFDRELAEELDFHREMLEIEKAQSGLDREIATAAARRQLGNMSVAREDARDAWVFRWLESTVRDTRLALRGCRRAPVFSLAAVLTLSLGIGANAAVFQVLDAVVLRPLPVRQAKSLVRLQGLRDGKRVSFTYPLFREMAARQTSLEGLFAAIDVPGVTVARAASDPFAGASARLATGNFFRVLGIDARIGRVFADGDDGPSSAPVAVISHGFWRRAFGGRPDVPGQTLRVNNVLVTVIGVTAADFFGDQIGSSPDVWLPMSLATDLSVGWLLQPGSSLLSPMGRLRAGVSPDQAQAVLDGLYRQLADYDMKIAGTKTVALEVQPGARASRDPGRPLASFVDVDGCRRAGGADRLLQPRQPAPGTRRGAHTGARRTTGAAGKSAHARRPRVASPRGEGLRRRTGGDFPLAGRRCIVAGAIVLEPHSPGFRVSPGRSAPCATAVRPGELQAHA